METADEAGISGSVNMMLPTEVSDQNTVFTSTSTTAGPLKVTDFCPGVDYLLHPHHITNTTFLQVNVSDCGNPGLNPTAHQGVVYGVCEDLTTFCTLRVGPPEGRRVLASLQRLEYWCSARQWATWITPGSGDRRKLLFRCNRHSLQEVLVGLDGKLLVSIENINSPNITIRFVMVQSYNFVLNKTDDFSGYVTTPYVSGAIQNFRVDWKLPFKRAIMVSVQQIDRNDLCHSRSVPKFYPSFMMKLNSKVSESGDKLSVACTAKATVVYTSHLKMEFSKGYHESQHRFLKMYVSTLPPHHHPIKLPSGQLNCSVMEYSSLRPHVDCNLKTQCEDGRDEGEDCAFSSPDCQGLVASHHKCFQLLHLRLWTPPALSQHECQRIGGRPASIKTRKEQEDLLHMFQHFFQFSVYIGCNSGWQFMPFVYRKFRRWSDKALIYNLNHFVIAWHYVPSRRVKFVIMDSMAIRPIFRPQVITILCEKHFQPPVVSSSHRSLGPLHSSASVLTATLQSLHVCPGSHLTHLFLPCQSSCVTATPFTDCGFSNASDTQLTDRVGPDRRFQSSDVFFSCGEDTTTVHHTLLCDFRKYCPGGSDESFCQHPSCTGFLCNSGQCVLSGQRCDQHSDCVDESDEFYCPGDPSYLAWFKDEDLKQWLYVNLDGTGYFTQQVMSADQSCPDSHYRCKAELLYCLPVYTRCNGFSDCVYGEDEDNCNTLTCSGFYRCRSSRVCVHGDHLCDGWGQCPQHDDELMCDFTCPKGCLCQGHAFVCKQPFPSDLYPGLRYLDATGSNMSLADLIRNTYLVHLTLSQCSLFNISHSQLLNLKHVDLANNHLRTVNLTVFLKLIHLTTLRLGNNPLGKLQTEEIHSIHYALTALDASETDVNILHSSMSLHLPEAKVLNVSHSAVDVVGPSGLKTIPQLRQLDVTGNPLSSFPLDLFSGSDHIDRILTSNFRLCCKNLLPKHWSEIKCSMPDIVLPSCAMLFPSELHRVFFWVLGIAAVTGNSLCFLTSSALAKVLGSHWVRLTSHLHLANLCMGSHTTILLLVNHVFQGTYIQSEKAWTDSGLCKLAGFLSLLAGVVSSLVLLFLTGRHTVLFCCPDQSWRFSPRFTSTACGVLWAVGFLMAAVPFLPGLSHWGLQGQSGLCRLALFDSDPSGQRFRWFTVTVVLNAVWSVGSVAGQAFIYRHTPQYRIALAPSQKSAFSSVHVVRTLAGTEAVCWMAFLLAVTTRAYGVTVSGHIHDSMVVFVVPLNSALNPLLYLWKASTQWQQQRHEDRMVDVLKLRLAQTGKQPCKK